MKKGTRLNRGVNDADYPISKGERINGKYKTTWTCPFYSRWKDMLKRCYSENYHQQQPTYNDCTVCDEWLYFSNFKKWMEKQDWEGKQLDKDFLVKGNRVYSPDTCVFLHSKINSFFLDCGSNRGKYLIGVGWREDRGKFRASCRDPFTGKWCHLGYFTSEEEAHEAWRLQKKEHAIKLAESEWVTEERVRAALQNWFI